MLFTKAFAAQLFRYMHYQSARGMVVHFLYFPLSGATLHLYPSLSPELLLKPHCP